MATFDETLLSALGLGTGEHVAVVGGGGKTTLCFALADALGKRGKKVVSTTTTKVWQEEAQAFPRVVRISSNTPPAGLLDDPRAFGGVFVTSEFLQSGKAAGVASEFADSLFANPVVDHVIIEADGAAGRPVKSPADHEPVIPNTVTLVISVMGLSALGQELGADQVFRMDRFKALTGLREGDVLTSERLVKAFDGAAGLFKNAPASARRMIFLNQLDILKDEAPARDLAGKLLAAYPFLDRVVMASIPKERFVTLKGGEDPH